MGKAECKNVLSGGSDNVDRASHEPRKIVPTKRLQRSTAHDVLLLIARFYPSVLHVRLLGSKFQFLRLTHFAIRTTHKMDPGFRVEDVSQLSLMKLIHSANVPLRSRQLLFSWTSSNRRMCNCD